MKRRALVAGLCVALAGLAGAGGANAEGVDQDSHLPRLFGDVRDVSGYRPLEGARIEVRMKGAPQPMIVTTDAEGRFKLDGVARIANPDAMKIGCSLEGYRLLNLSRRKLGKDVDGPVEIKCLLEKE